MELYLFAAFGCVEPSVLGPFVSDDARILAARNYKKENGDESAIFRLNVENGIPTTQSFVDDELEISSHWKFSKDAVQYVLLAHGLTLSEDELDTITDREINQDEVEQETAGFENYSEQSSAGLSNIEDQLTELGLIGGDKQFIAP